jgi:hypothetical protein
MVTDQEIGATPEDENGKTMMGRQLEHDLNVCHRLGPNHYICRPPDPKGRVAGEGLAETNPLAEPQLQSLDSLVPQAYAGTAMRNRSRIACSRRSEKRTHGKRPA